ncbi:MAG TPA: alpha-galactosidase [Treponemataceae bacterium]|nr:alpha-galactosidase [Treponemataceae bacterium]
MIRFDETRKLWILETRSAAYVFGVSQRGSSVDGFPFSRPAGEGLLLQTWFGPRLGDPADYPEALPEAGWASFSTPETLSPEILPVAGGPRYGEPSLAAVFPDGVRDLRLEYRSWKADKERLVVTLADPVYGLEADLEFEVFPEYDLFSRRTVVRNPEKSESPAPGAARIESLLSGAVYLPRGTESRLTHLTGRWVGETQLQRIPLPLARTVLESVRGFTSHHANPFFALDADSRATEEDGPVWFGELAWSGNWKISLERDSFGQTRVSPGYHDRDFSSELSPGDSLESPLFLFGFTERGFGAMSRSLHAWQRNLLSPSGTENRKVLYNSWEATAFSVDSAGQEKLASLAASCGVELFVMDDGWFGARSNDSAGLGDWYVNAQKFPGGLSPLIERIRELGMSFGLWVEPEMVNPDSDLYRAHPGWVYHYPGRERTEMRNQLVLNLSLPEVEDYVFSFMDRLLSENRISFIKWDLNRSVSEPGGPPEHRRDANLRHIEAVYRVVSRLRERHPAVRFQTCSGGGGRADIGILRHFDQAWTSDNTDACDRLLIQEGFSWAYGAHVMEAWVTAKKNWLNGRTVPLEFRFHAAMAGVLGIGENLCEWDEAEASLARSLIELYKDIRPLVQRGNLYRLESPANGNRASFLYIDDAKTRAVLFVFLEKNNFGTRLPPLMPRGLDPAFRYALSVLSPAEPPPVFPPTGSSGAIGTSLRGDAWMNRGVAIPLREDRTSMVLEFKKIEAE